MTDHDPGWPADLWPEPDTADLPSDSGPRTWVWSAMEPQDRATRLRELRTWVSWLETTFDLDGDIPACWYRHQAIVEHLTALYLGWVRTYTQEPEPGRNLIEAEWIGTLHAYTPHFKRANCTKQHADTPRRAARAYVEEDFTQHLADLTRQTSWHPAPDEAERFATTNNTF